MYIDDRVIAWVAKAFDCDVVVVQYVIDGIEEERRQMQAELEKAAAALQEMADDAAAEYRAEEINPFYPCDFSCICPAGMSRHTLSWYTSGFE